MLTELQDLRSLFKVTCSSKETPLIELVERIKSTPERYSLKRSTLYQSHWLIWDNVAKDFVLVTHAFAVRQASHPRTGNFVPDGEKAPEGLLEAQIKSEPGPYAQLSITMDARLDEHLHEHLTALEVWAKAEPGFVTTGRSRNPWMSPTSVVNNGRYVITSPLFMGKNTFNSKEEGIVASYDVHPWVDKAVAAEPTWIPNPNLVRLLHLNDDRSLVDLASSSKPLLAMGDILKTTFKFVFTSYGQYWNMSCSPIQAIRLGQLDKSAYGAIVNLEDNGRLDLPRAGEKLVEFFNLPSGFGSNFLNAPAVTQSREARGEDASDAGSVSWGSLTPPSEEESTADPGGAGTNKNPDTASRHGKDGGGANADAPMGTVLPATTKETTGGKPTQSGSGETTAIGDKTETGRGKKRAAASTGSKKTRTVRARTGT